MTVVFGAVCLDRVRRLPHLPVPGGYVEVVEESLVLGGEAANTALALQAWGGTPVLATHALGDDPMGEELRARVLKHGLDVRELQNGTPSQAPVCDVLVTPDGRRTMIGRGFTALDDSIDLARLPLENGSLFAADPNVPRASREAVRKARAAGMTTYLMDFHGEEDPLAPGVYWQSSTDWVGRWGDAAENVAVVEALVRRGVFAILTDGPNGLVAGGPELPVRAYPTFPAPRVLDTTGAGDAFRAAMLHGLDRRWAFAACLSFAAATGSLAVGYAGASSRIPALREIAAHLAANPDVAAAYV